MHFVDETWIQVKAGDGGHGCVSFHREMRMDRMGPDGGDGGRGGDIIFEAVDGLDTLMDYAVKKHWKAQSGQPGTGSNCSGRGGKDLVLKMPTGTLIFDRESGRLLKDLDVTGMKVRICRGGRGGLGNQNFATSTRQSPRFATQGEQGQERTLRLELKLIADVGLVGLPNAGKSTLLSVVSAARPKIANYPFTTLTPQPGIVDLPGHRRFVMADIPGLIEGAHEGRGLGDQFLRHIERTRVILHLIDVNPPTGWPGDHYQTIRNELEKYSPILASKPEVVCLTKLDTDEDADLFNTIRQDLSDRYGLDEVLGISAVTGQGVSELLNVLWNLVEQARRESPPPKLEDDVSVPVPPHRREQMETVIDSEGRVLPAAEVAGLDWGESGPLTALFDASLQDAPGLDDESSVDPERRE